jgi:hypothetical protein
MHKPARPDLWHKHNEFERIFFYVRKIDKYEDNYWLIYFNKFGSFQIFDIDRCIGFFKIENLYYILDREKWNREKILMIFF